ncbi:hypothetical protein SuNHUV7_34460 (plasmid) [Pseudoseohaeicola sp. NH-UV-7]|uniref:hypothetical protein n=1 Tax=Sulfitobacter sp. TBRI5 TaxID=2989732 RepID=UPI003A733D1B
MPDQIRIDRGVAGVDACVFSCAYPGKQHLRTNHLRPKTYVPHLALKFIPAIYVIRVIAALIQCAATVDQLRWNMCIVDRIGKRDLELILIFQFPRHRNFSGFESFVLP